MFDKLLHPFGKHLFSTNVKPIFPEFSVSKLTLKEGDTLIVKIKDFVPLAKAIQIREYLLSNIPSGIKVLILTDVVSLSILSKE